MSSLPSSAASKLEASRAKCRISILRRVRMRKNSEQEVEKDSVGPVNISRDEGGMDDQFDSDEELMDDDGEDEDTHHRRDQY